MVLRYFSTCCLCFFFMVSWGQEITPIPGTKVLTSVKEKKAHSPKKATILSALVPGLGQVYNKKYWKVPLVYATLGTSAYYIRFNKRNWDRTRADYLFLLNKENRTATENNNLNTLNNAKEFYRRYHEISWFALAGSYILNILDAAVDAHLFHFEVSEDLSLHWQPRVTPNQIGFGIQITRK